MAPEPKKDAHDEGGYGPHMKTVGWAILVMGLSLVAVIGLYMWFGHIGPSFSSSVLQQQQATLRQKYGLPVQQTSSAQLEVPPSLRGIENGMSAVTSTASNATGGNQTAATNQTAANANVTGSQIPAVSNQTAGGNATNSTTSSSNATAANQTSAASGGSSNSSAGGGGGGAATTTTTSSSSTTTSTTAVSITPGSSSKTDNAFDPNPVKAKLGDTITWTNHDSTPHTVTSGTNAKPDGKFNSSPGFKTLISPGQTFSHKFTEAGEYPYFCQLHPNMVGTVSVR
jgi:plastocyanin